MSDIFISYSSENKSETEKLAIALESQGWSVWWDRSIPVGKSYEIIIEEALDEAKCVIVVWSKQSVKSQWVRAEAAEAQNQSKLFPLKIDNSNPPLIYRALQTADFVNWSGEISDPAFKQIADDIGNHIGKPAIQVESVSISQKEEVKQEQLKYKEIQQKEVELERKKQLIKEEKLKQEKIKQEQLKAKQNATKKVSESPVKESIRQCNDKKNSNEQINTDARIKKKTVVHNPQFKQKWMGILFLVLVLISMVYFFNQSYQKKVELQTFRKITLLLVLSNMELIKLKNFDFKGELDRVKGRSSDLPRELDFSGKSLTSVSHRFNIIDEFNKRIENQVKLNENGIQEIEAMAIFNDNSVESENMKEIVKKLKNSNEKFVQLKRSLSNVLNTMHQGARNSIRNIRP